MSKTEGLYKQFPLSTFGNCLQTEIDPNKITMSHITRFYTTSWSRPSMTHTQHSSFIDQVLTIMCRVPLTFLYAFAWYRTLGLHFTPVFFQGVPLQLKDLLADLKNCAYDTPYEVI
jgi:hypothetical protein